MDRSDIGEVSDNPVTTLLPVGERTGLLKQFHEGVVGSGEIIELAGELVLRKRRFQATALRS